MHKGFEVGFEKVADLISPEVYKKLSDYDKKKLVGVRDALSMATKPGKELSQDVRQKVIEGAADTMKNMSWSLSNASLKKVEHPHVMECSKSEVKAPAKL